MVPTRGIIVGIMVWYGTSTPGYQQVVLLPYQQVVVLLLLLPTVVVVVSTGTRWWYHGASACLDHSLLGMNLFRGPYYK